MGESAFEEFEVAETGFEVGAGGVFDGFAFGLESDDGVVGASEEEGEGGDCEVDDSEFVLEVVDHDVAVDAFEHSELWLATHFGCLRFSIFWV